MLTDQDYYESNRSINVLYHAKEGTSRLTTYELIGILEFILTMAKVIMYDKNGKPKNLLQLALSLPQLVRFIVAVIKKINEVTRKKGISTIR